MTLYERSKALQEVKKRELLQEFDFVFEKIKKIFLYPEVTRLKILILCEKERLAIVRPRPYNTCMINIEFTDIPNIVLKYGFKSDEDVKDFNRDFLYYLYLNTDFEFVEDEYGDTLIKIPSFSLF